MFPYRHAPSFHFFPDGPLRIMSLLCFIAMLSAGLWSCDKSRVFDESSRIRNAEWNRHWPVFFQFPIQDTNALYNVYLQIRNTTDYPFSNLYLFLSTREPDGTKGRDTVECILAGPDGKWTGQGPGKLKANKLLVKKGMRFQHRGTYQIGIEQAMRTEVLTGIADVGIRVEKE
ncbi:MAG: gliding motility lipoprotein GldH [Bacteroidetes bacterium]|nr:gliding motility lipoprotein GldH [Bacteroidota bacterium]